MSCSNPSSSSTALNHSSLSHHIDENVDDNDEESSHSSTPSSPQLISSLSNVVLRVFENPPHESQSLNSYQTKIINHRIQHRDEHRQGLSYHTSLSPSSSSQFSSLSSSMSCSNPPLNFSRKPRILVHSKSFPLFEK
ncbi:hypothetical protein Tco_0451028 [Tanacetum coccineum]